MHNIPIRFRRRKILLTVSEHKIFLCLSACPNTLVTRRYLHAVLYGNSFVGRRAVDIHVSRLRKKLASVQDSTHRIDAILKDEGGYKFRSHA